jgi:hypothetical protein
MILYAVIFVYAIAMTLANLSIAKWGVWLSPINAFLFIGLDLALRDWLHEKLKMHEMLALIVVSGVLTYAFNSSAGMIAVASALSFTVAAFADWLTFSKVNGSWSRKSNSSNVVGAAVDSLVFPTLAFGVLMPEIVAVQFVAKVFGGFFWSFLINKFLKK